MQRHDVCDHKKKKNTANKLINAHVLNMYEGKMCLLVQNLCRSTDFKLLRAATIRAKAYYKIQPCYNTLLLKYL